MWRLRIRLETWAWDRGYARLHDLAWGGAGPCPCDRSGRPGPLSGRWAIRLDAMMAAIKAGLRDAEEARH